MGFLTSIGSVIVGPLIDKLLGPFLELAKVYINKQMTIEELRSKMVIAMLAAFDDVEKSHADALTKTYATFMGQVEKSLLLRVVWASVTISQLLVLLWHQLGIPALCYYLHDKNCYPSSGSTVEWAYALLGACVGLGPMVLRTGPSALDPSKWKSLITK